LQILSVTVFERTPLIRLLTNMDYKLEQPDDDNQLRLFD
jgi:hypothetical protein